MRAVKIGLMAGAGIALLYKLRALRSLERKDTESVHFPSDLGLKPHHTINLSEYARQYAAKGPLWDKAFLFLRTHDLSTLAPGDYPLDGDDAVVKVSFGRGKEKHEVKWETHRKFVDIQIVGAGKEMIGVTSIYSASISIPYDKNRDITYYDTDGPYYSAEPGTFFLFFPLDVHRPGIKTDDADIRKIVVKILAAG